MNAGTIIAIVAVIVVLVVAVLVVRPLLRRRRLQERFGPEYDRAVDTHQDRSAAERDLVEREKRYKELDLRPLSPEARERYGAEWTMIQAQFVDTPERTVTDADRLVTALMAERGYPTEGYEQQLADLSVEHSTTLGHYRDAHDVHQRVGDGQVSTEDLRGAMVHFRALFVELLEPDDDTTAAERADRDADVRDAEVRDANPVDADGVVRDGGGRYDDGVVRDSEGRNQNADLVTDAGADSDVADGEPHRTTRHHTAR